MCNDLDGNFRFLVARFVLITFEEKKLNLFFFKSEKKVLQKKILYEWLKKCATSDAGI